MVNNPALTCRRSIYSALLFGAGVFMKQSRLASLIEAGVNTALGFLVSFAVWPVAALITGISYNNTQHWTVIAIFTVSSIVRGYAVRRFFASGIHTASAAAARFIATK